jgi:aromatic-L-amino-acid decarboxylase
MNESKMNQWRSNDWRNDGYQAIDWVAKYLENVEQLPVQSARKPGETRAMLPNSAPEEPDSMDSVWSDLDEIIAPGLLNWQSPTFFGYFPANNSPPSIVGELLAAGMGVQGMLWSTSPACTELESLVLDWLVELLGLPAAFRTDGTGGGVIQDSASSATLCAMIAARDRATEGTARSQGVRQPVTVYASSDAHSSVEKAAMVCGIGSDNVRHIGVDGKRRLDPKLLREIVQADLADGKIPAMVTATVGTTACGAIDDVLEISQICREHDLWLHVDAAMLGSAALSPQFRSIHDGLQFCDSYCFNPHKWLLVNFDCDCFYVRDRQWLTRSLSVNPEYLRNAASEAGDVIDYRDWQIPLGRRFRALKVWLVLRLYGAKQLREMVESHCQLAADFADWVRQTESLQLETHQLNLVTFRHQHGNDASAKLIQRVNDSNRVFLTHAKLGDHYVIRVCIGQRCTSRTHVELLEQIIESCLRD